jgi:isopenicillin-N epimerase
VRRPLSYAISTDKDKVIQERQGFGSFHSDDIEDLVRMTDAAYKQPDVYSQVQQRTEEFMKHVRDATNNFEFGKVLKQNMYCIDPAFTFLNHGAFGAATRMGIQEANYWRELCETQPLRFFDRILLPMVAHVIRATSKSLGCSAPDLMPLPNVTAGLNAVASSVHLKANDEVVCLSLTYGSTKKILARVCAESKAKLVIVQLSLPIQSKDSLLTALSQCINTKTKLVVLDAITSNTALELPVHDMAVLCKRQSPEVVVVVDAAHSFFAQKINISHISQVADIYVTNGHKWLSCPKGCAFMWISPHLQGRIRPAIISHGFIPSTSSSNARGIYSEKGRVLSGFSWDGCRDYSALLTVPSTLGMWAHIGRAHSNYEDGCRTSARDYMRRTLNGGTTLLTKQWNVDVDRFVGPQEMRVNSPMMLVTFGVSLAYLLT